jgi:hypothetical protein
MLISMSRHLTRPISGGLDNLRGPYAASVGWLIDLIVSLTLATKDL